jgi:hypothetical protein
LEFCETNRLILEIFDCENIIGFNNFSSCKDTKNEESLSEFYIKNSKNSEEKILLIDDQKIQVEEFFEKIGLCNNNSKDEAFKECFICKRKILNELSSEKNKLSNKTENKINKCELCMKISKKNLTSYAFDEKMNKRSLGNECLKNFTNKLTNKEKYCNRYNFIEKLKIKEFYVQNPEKSFFEKDEKSLEFSSENINPLNCEISYDKENSESTNTKSLENKLSFLDF